MRVRLSGLVLTVVSLALLAATARAGDDAQKGQKGKRAEGEKVEMKDVPSAVTDAAKKELPNATFSAAEKRTAKKQGTIYTLEGKDGKFQVSVMYTSTGELQRLTKSVEARKKKTK
jgi:hypothetical protein